MGEPKAFASLSSGLLARKGAARPAMRPQGFGGQNGAGLEDLGWNDMGFEPPKPAIAPVRDEDHDAFGEELADQPLRNPLAALTPIASPVHDQQAEIENRFASHDEDGEDEDGEYVDETAELYDQDTENAGPIVAEAEPVAFVPDSIAEPEPVAFVPESNDEFEAVAFVPESIVEPKPATAPTPVRERRPRAQPGAKGKSAFTLRLDPSRHLKLRLACAVNGSSAQQLVTDALDQLLNGMPELDTMAERAPRKSA